MPLVAGDDEAECTDGDRIAVGHPAPRELLVVQVPEEVDRRGTNRLEFVDEIANGPLVEPAGGRIRILIKAGKGLGEALAYARSTGMSPAGLERMLALRKTVSGADWERFITEGNVGPAKR